MAQRDRLMLGAAAIFFATALAALAASFVVGPGDTAIARVVAFVFLLVALVSLVLDVLQRRPPRRPGTG
jgi:hypothetical protein